MSESKTRRVALVTGGAVRLGRAISLGLAKHGYDLVVHFNSSREPAEEVATAVRAMGRRCALAQADLTLPEGAGALMQATRDAYGRLDLLVNSAAGFDMRPLMDVDHETWDDVMALNVRAPHLLVREAASLLSEARGAVVNMVDLSAVQPWTAYPVHSVSKAALAHLTRVQARTLAPDVRVNAIAPGAVLPPADYLAEKLETIRMRTPLRTLGEPDDVVRTVLFLADATFITGQIIAVDGGRLLGSSDPPNFLG